MSSGGQMLGEIFQFTIATKYDRLFIYILPSTDSQ